MSCQAPSEAEAQCAELARGGKVRATAIVAFNMTHCTLGICSRLRGYGYPHFQRAYPVQTLDVFRGQEATY
jgi:hypothetical protein